MHYFESVFQVQKICKFGLLNIWKQAKSRVEFHRQNLFNDLSSIYAKKYLRCLHKLSGGGGGGTTRPLPRDGGAEELRGDPTVGPHPKVWTIDRE